MISVRRALSAAACVAASGALLAAPAVAAPVGSGPTSDSGTSSAGCYTLFTFTANSYVRSAPRDGATHLGLAYAGDRFDYQGQSQNGFWYGRDVRAGGATGWVPAANVRTQRVCD